MLGRDGVAREDVVAVDLRARHAEAARPEVERVRDCVLTGTEIAQWLFWRKKTCGVWKLAAKTNASLTSPWLVAPSP
ncbi:hypothetical protein MAFF212519_05220 [Clavibacter michiganensis]